MGNRACVVFHDADAISPACYLHWNGGPESVYAFLAELKRRNVHLYDPAYRAARFLHVVGDFFDEVAAGASGLGVLPPPKRLTPRWLSELDEAAEDNGVYLVSLRDDGEWIVRRFFRGRFLKDAEVAKEKENALSHLYNTGSPSIAETFASIRPRIQK